MKAEASWYKLVLLITFLMMVLPLATEVKGQSSARTDVSWISYAEAAEKADAEEKKVMIFLEADWCMVCKRMHREVFTNNEVFSLINSDFYPVRLDIESDDMIPVNGETISKKEYSKSIGIYGTPTILFLNSKEEVIGNFVGYSDDEEMKKLLTFISSDAYLTERLDDYSYD